MPSRIKHAIPQVDTTIGETLARIRKDLGLTQVELAEKVGISQQQLSNYEQGNIHISAEMIIRFSEVLKVSTDELLNKEEFRSSGNLSLRFTRRIRELDALPENKKKAILQVLDDLIRANS